MVAAIKMDELLVSWLSSDAVYEHILDWIETSRATAEAQRQQQFAAAAAAAAAASSSSSGSSNNNSIASENDGTVTAAADVTAPKDSATVTTASSTSSNDPRKESGDLRQGGSNSNKNGTSSNKKQYIIPPLYPPLPKDVYWPTIVSAYSTTISPSTSSASLTSLAADDDDDASGISLGSSTKKQPPPPRRRRTPPGQHDAWEPLPEREQPATATTTTTPSSSNVNDSSSLTNDKSVDGKSNSTPSSPMPTLTISTATAVGSGDNQSSSDPVVAKSTATTSTTTDGTTTATSTATTTSPTLLCARDHARVVYEEVGQSLPILDENSTKTKNDWNCQTFVAPDKFVRITKEVCRFPSYFNLPLYQRILDLWNGHHVITATTAQTNSRKGSLQQQQQHQQAQQPPPRMDVVTFAMLEWYWKREMEPFDSSERFYRLVKQPHQDFIVRDDFLPFVKALLNDHPGLEFLSSHAEFQEKYAVTVITRIFYSVNRGHSGRITSRQIRRSDLLEAFQQVDEEEDINKVTRYFSYEHFYVLYCRFWELDHDRDYRITRDDLLKYGDHSLSHMIVDRIFDAAPRPFEQDRPNRDYLSYEDFIFFMLSEEDKSNEVSVRYWFSCVDVDGDQKLNNMEMRSFYAVQLHRMQCMGHEVVPFEDMLCQMMDMIKPASTSYLIVEDFLRPECCQVSGALFDALFNLNKYLMFESRDPFAERQKREDEFECDWDRFACIDYNRLAMEEEAREEEAMEIDWVTVDEDEPATGGSAGTGAGGGNSSGGGGGGGDLHGDGGGPGGYHHSMGGSGGPGSNEAPF